MQFYLFLCLTILTSYAVAEETEQFYEAAAQTQTFIPVKNPLAGAKFIWLSKNCGAQEKNCLALAHVKELYKKEKFHADSFANPGIYLCQDIGGKILGGKDKQKNEIAFCSFEDNSLISLGTLQMLSLSRPKGGK